MKPDAEEVNAEAKLIMARIIARKIATDPATVDRALAGYSAWSDEERATKPACWWIEVLTQGPEAVRRRIVQRDETAYWMRNSTPIVLSEGLDCLREVEFRRRIWRDAKRLLMLQIRRRQADVAVIDGIMAHHAPPGGPSPEFEAMKARFIQGSVSAEEFRRWTVARWTQK